MKDHIKELEKKGLELDESKDQHFMVDESLLSKIVEQADISGDEVVLEVGAGSGNLTKRIASQAKQVFAIEKDLNMKRFLNDEFPPGSNVYVVYADALKTDFPFFDKIVSNLPASICEPFFHRLFKYFFKKAVLTVPKTFAEKLTANPGEEGYSKLSLLVQAFFDVRIVAEAPRTAFHPEQGFDSAILLLKSKKESSFLKDLFVQKRKRVKHALREALFNNGLSKSEASKKISESSVSKKVLDKRVSELSISEIKNILSEF